MNPILREAVALQIITVSASRGSRGLAAPCRDFLSIPLTSTLQGLPATVTLKSGERFSGIFSSSSLEQQEYRYTFKMVKRLPSLGGQVNGTSESHDEYCGVGRDYRMTFEVKDVVVLNVDNVSMDKAKTKNGECFC